MKTSGPAADAAVRAPDLAQALADPGPFATVYLATPADIENAAQRSDVSWRNLRGELEEEGAAEEAVGAIDPLVPDAHRFGSCLAAVATARGIRHVEYGPEPGAGDVGRWAALPLLAPIIEWRQTSPPFVVVLTDRTGAHLYAFRREGPDVHREAAGDEDPAITRTKPGGWSQRRFQERAENVWEQNAEEVAKATVRLAEQVRARLVVAAGETRALQLLRDSLPKETVDILEPLEGERWSDRTIDDLRDDVGGLVRAAADHDTAGLIGAWREQVGRDDRATDGVAATVASLSRSQADTLLLRDDLADDRSAWFGPDPSQLSSRAEDLATMGVDDPQQGRLVDVLIRAALGTGAGVVVVPEEASPSEGVGAILRWSD